MFPASHRVLLRAIRVLSCLSMYAGFHVVTEARIRKGKVLLQQFGSLIKV